MTNKKSMKRALISSLLIMAMCFTMLAGTTYAWFTDSVTSANNIIKSGKLDIVAEYFTNAEDDNNFANDNNWKEITEDELLFDDDMLWEPGAVQVAYIRLRNAGNLAFKYKLDVKKVTETAGKNQAGETFYLRNYLKFGTADVDAPYGADGRADAISAVEADATIIQNTSIVNGATMLPGDSKGPIALVIYMPTTVGNEANYGDKQPQITLGLTIFAAQEAYEEDSFDDQYDANALYSTEIAEPATGSQLNSAITSSAVKQVVVNEDVSNTRVATGTFGGGTKDIYFGDNTYTQTDADTYGILLRGTSNFTFHGEDGGINAAGYGVWVSNANAVANFESGNYRATTHVVYVEKGTAYISGGFFEITSGETKYLLNCYDANYTNGTANIVVTGGTFVNFDPSASMGEPGGPVSFVADGYHVEAAQQTNGDIWYTVVAD